MYPYHNSLEAELNFFAEFNPLADVTPQRNLKTNAEFNTGKNIHIKYLIREFALRTFWGSNLTGPVHSKAFQLNSGDTRTHPESIKKIRCYNANIT